MTGKISCVINTLNEENNIERAINSVGFCDEILVCDMNSEDNTALIAKKLGAKVIFHKKTGYVEPARNFAISKSSHEWVLILDADEEIPDTLAKKLQEIVSNNGVTTHVEIPRKNIIFGKWMKASMWWPDNNIRFFKKEKVLWSDKIHSKPKAEGQGITLPAEERWAIIHHHYDSVSQFLDRLNRYTDVQAKELLSAGDKFKWEDLLDKPLNEFLSRYFANRGFEDQLHGLSLSLLQAFSFLVLYLKLWEKEGFEQKEISFSDFKQLSQMEAKQLDYWFKYGNLPKNKLKRAIQKIKNRVL